MTIDCWMGEKLLRSLVSVFSARCLAAPGFSFHLLRSIVGMGGLCCILCGGSCVFLCILSVVPISEWILTPFFFFSLVRVKEYVEDPRKMLLV
jgi:hypothetical protein